MANGAIAAEATFMATPIACTAFRQRAAMVKVVAKVMARVFARAILLVLLATNASLVPMVLDVMCALSVKTAVRAMMASAVTADAHVPRALLGHFANILMRLLAVDAVRSPAPDHALVTRDGAEPAVTDVLLTTMAPLANFAQVPCAVLAALVILLQAIASAKLASTALCAVLVRQTTTTTPRASTA